MIIQTNKDFQEKVKIYLKLICSTNTFYVWKLSCLIQLIVMFTSSPGCQYQLQNSMKIQRQFHVTAPREIFTTSIQAIKESSDDKSSFDASKIHRLQVHYSKSFPIHFVHHFQFDCLLTTMLLHLIKQNQQNWKSQMIKETKPKRN